MRALSVLFAAVLFAQPVMAGETPWQEVAPGVKLRLISTGVVDADGTTRAAIEIDMPPSTKTYWRVPGETGLPTELDSSGSSGVAAVAIDWPYPVRDAQQGYLDYVYYGHTVLPLTIEAQDPVPRLELAAVLGICSDICIPAQASFSLPLQDAAPDRPNGLRIRQALAEVPIAWEEGEAPLGGMRWAPDGDGLVVELSDPDVDPDSLIASAGEGGLLFGAPQKSLQGDLVVLPILGKTDNSALHGLNVRIAFMTSRGPFEVIGTPVAPPKG
ncbi:hypothetical protein IC608_08415 [Devosia sp. PTR5]|uniref:Thiol:disulfide interchange protein DsbD N-terminal domain-containing protein n=1 Tax=Devosia oryzisoli TaxID=2774138 RepID=A0A927FWV9_9HYPH|nr:protein-disulfide reductase DsbD domain-containing protein [Devosia oryzisoli]MBD8065496.1 hypothetical protein [Devosia oryzisoli]